MLCVYKTYFVLCLGLMRFLLSIHPRVLVQTPNTHRITKLVSSSQKETICHGPFKDAMSISCELLGDTVFLKEFAEWIGGNHNKTDSADEKCSVDEKGTLEIKAASFGAPSDCQHASRAKPLIFSGYADALFVGGF